MQSWKTLSRRMILDYSQFLSVEEHTVELPNGHIIADWPWVITPDFVNVVTVTDDDRFVCFRQTKYGIDGTSLAPVGGFLEQGEEPLVAAQRELLEETGYEAGQWTSLGSYRVDANRGSGMAHFFLARNAKRVQEAQPDDLEEQELVYLTQAELAKALAAGDFKVLPWATVVALVLARMEE